MRSLLPTAASERTSAAWAPARTMKLCSHRVLSISMRADGDHAWGTVGMTKQRWVRHWLVCRENFPRPSEEKHTQACSGRWHLADVVDFLCNNTTHGLERTVVARPADIRVGGFKTNHTETINSLEATSCTAAFSGETFNSGWLKCLEWGCSTKACSPLPLVTLGVHRLQIRGDADE